MRSFAFAIDPLSGSQTQRTSLVWVFLFGEALAFVDFAMRDHSVLQHDSNSHLAKKSKNLLSVERKQVSRKIFLKFSLKRKYHSQQE